MKKSQTEIRTNNLTIISLFLICLSAIFVPDSAFSANDGNHKSDAIVEQIESNKKDIIWFSSKISEIREIYDRLIKDKQTGGADEIEIKKMIDQRNEHIRSLEDNISFIKKINSDLESYLRK